MHMAGLSGIVNRTVIASNSHHPRGHQNNGILVRKSSCPAGVHNGVPAIINGVGVGGNGGPSFLANNRISNDGLSEIPTWLAYNSQSRNGSRSHSISFQANPQQQLDHRSRQMSAHRRWLSRNKVGPQTIMNGNIQIQRHSVAFQQQQQFKYRPGQKYRETLGASVLLYMGIGMIVVGLVITFVGIGDHAFHTIELQLIGPTVMTMGLLLCGIRILICAFANKCDWCDQRIDDEDIMVIDDHQTNNQDDLFRQRRISNLSHTGSVRSWKIHPKVTPLSPVMSHTLKSRESSSKSSTSALSLSLSLRGGKDGGNSDDDFVATQLAIDSSMTSPSIPSSLFSSKSSTVSQQPVRDFHMSRNSSVSSSSSEFQQVQLIATMSMDDDNNDTILNQQLEKTNNNNDDHDDGHRSSLKNPLILNPSSLTS